MFNKFSITYQEEVRGMYGMVPGISACGSKRLSNIIEDFGFTFEGKSQYAVTRNGYDDHSEYTRRNIVCIRR